MTTPIAAWPIRAVLIRTAAGELLLESEWVHRREIAPREVVAAGTAKACLAARRLLEGPG